MGSLKIISKVPIIDHSISTKSEVILEVKSPLLFVPINDKGREIIFFCKSILISCIIPFLIGVRKNSAKYLNRFLKKNIANTKIQININASVSPLLLIVLLII